MYKHIQGKLYNVGIQYCLFSQNIDAKLTCSISSRLSASISYETFSLQVEYNSKNCDYFRGDDHFMISTVTQLRRKSVNYNHETKVNILRLILFKNLQKVVSQVFN